MIEITAWWGGTKTHVAAYEQGRTVVTVTVCGRRIPNGAVVWEAQDQVPAAVCGTCRRICWPSRNGGSAS